MTATYAHDRYSTAERRYLINGGFWIRHFFETPLPRLRKYFRITSRTTRFKLVSALL